MRLILTTLLLLLATQARATSCPSGTSKIAPESLTGPARQLLADLMAKGQTQVGELNLPQLSEQLGGITVCWYGGGFMPALNGDGQASERNTSMYFVEQKLVIIQRINWGYIANSQNLQTIALHEGMGALGFADENYQMSTTLKYMSAMDGAKLQKFQTEKTSRIFQNIQRRTTNLRARTENGGSTQTGGGGDSLGLEFKLSLFQEADEWVPTWVSWLRGQKICFADDVETLSQNTRLLVQLSEIESSNDPLRQYESFTPAADGQSFKAHLAAIFEGGIIRSQLGDGFISQMREQSFQHFERGILCMQRPGPCSAKGKTADVLNQISKLCRETP